MKYNLLGDSDLKVSELCLGTMTYGEQNTIFEAHEQLDLAIDRGINFIDTAEMYPVPPKAETYGLTETFIGKWLQTQPRDRVIIASKVAGPGRAMTWMRGKTRAIDRKNVIEAVEGSLKRLQTDYIDLYQIHWADRYIPSFGNTQFDPEQERPTVAIEEQLSVFAELVQAGKIRYVGLSNETPWGVCAFSQAAAKLGLPKVISIQNAYNLLNRFFDTTLVEACYRENVGLLAYSPLGGGVLTGKYLKTANTGGETSEGRMTLFDRFTQRYAKQNVDEAVAAYVEIAQHFNLTPAALALAFVRSRWFVTSTIIGATSVERLKSNIDSVDVELTDEILSAIDTIHDRFPNPAP